MSKLSSQQVSSINEATQQQQLNIPNYELFSIKLMLYTPLKMTVTSHYNTITSSCEVPL